MVPDHHFFGLKPKSGARVGTSFPGGNTPISFNKNRFGGRDMQHE
jgi:hypothetical protein